MGIDQKSTYDSGVTRRESFALILGMAALANGCGDPDQPGIEVEVKKGPPSTIAPGHPSWETDAHAPDVPDASDATSWADSSNDPDILTDDFGHRAIDATADEDAQFRPPADASETPDESQPPFDEGQPPEDVSEDVPAEEDIPPVDPDNGIPAEEVSPAEDLGQPAPDEGKPVPDEGQPPEDVETIAPMEIAVTAKGNYLNNDADVLLANFWFDVNTQDSGTFTELTFNITPADWPQFYGINVYLADADYNPLTPFQTIGKTGDSGKTLTVKFAFPSSTPIGQGSTLIKVMIKSLTSVPKVQESFIQVTTALVDAQIQSDKGPNQPVEINYTAATALSNNEFNT